ncbi:MAG TPA: hypothetical protein VI488_10855 [Candidatus Angelobacter sp.]
MPRISAFRVLVAVLCLAPLGHVQEVHLNEAGSGAILARSAFAHGYRHGYEEGYHLGNVDINMGRVSRTQLKTQFHGLKLKPGYSPSFGSKRLFEDGFEAGLKAGYVDGYAGQMFRAVDSLRLVAAAMEAAPEDPDNVYFDQGLAAGYREGRQQAEPSTPGAGPLDFHAVACVPFHPEKEQDLPAAGSYCEGYQRGYVLGQYDALALRGDSAFLEASK